MFFTKNSSIEQREETKRSRILLRKRERRIKSEKSKFFKIITDKFAAFGAADLFAVLGF